MADVIFGITFGQDCDTTNPDLDKLLKLNADFIANVEDAQLVAVLEFFPLAHYLPFKAYDCCIQPFFEMHGIIRKFLKERREKFNPVQPVRDLISGLLQAKYEAESENDEEKAALLTDDYFVNTILDMFIAGYETTSTTLKWVIAFLVHYPKYQEDIQAQLNEVVGDCYPTLTKLSKIVDHDKSYSFETDFG